MTTPAEERLWREGEERDRRRRQYERGQERLTVVKVVRAESQCIRCRHTWPYKTGDENRRCPACDGGDPKYWASGAIR